MKKVISLVVILTLTITSCLFSVQAAKKVKLNKSKATIKVGQTVSLKVKNTKKKTKWSSSNKQVATVNKKGKVIGKKAGKATITAKVGKKKYRCKVSVVAITKSNNTVQKPTVKPTEPTTTKPEETTTKEVVNPADWDYGFTESGTVVIRGYKGTKRAITFPSEIAGYKVTSITGLTKVVRDKYNEQWNYWEEKTINEGYNNLTEIVVPDSILNIGAGAFESCEFLQKIILPKQLKSIPSELFADCQKLTDIEIPNNVTNIGSCAFESCTSLSSIIIPNSVTSIGSCAFESCTSLSSIIIPNGVKTINEGTFAGCTNLKSVAIPNSVETIEGDCLYDSCSEHATGAFEYCKSLKTIIIPNSVITIGDLAFFESGLTEVIIPNSVKTIGGGAFAYCYGLTRITIPGSVSKIDACPSMDSYGTGAFEGCEGLTDVTIEYGVSNIAPNMFSSCPQLSNVSIPNSVTEISCGAFYECPKLKSLFVPNSVNSIFYQDPDDWSFPHFNDNSFDKTITLKGKSGSYVQTFANQNGYKFQLVQ